MWAAEAGRSFITTIRHILRETSSALPTSPPRTPAAVTGQYYLVQEPSGNGDNGNILLYNQPAEIQSLAVDTNQNVYFISTGVLYQLQFYGDGNYATMPVLFGTPHDYALAVSVDAAGNLYVVYAASPYMAAVGNATIYEIPNETTFGTFPKLNPADQFIVSSAVPPTASLAIGAHGDIYFPGPIYYAGSYAGTIDKLSLGEANFGAVVVGHTATRTINFQFNAETTPAAVKLPTGVFSTEHGSNGSVPCTAGVTYAPQGIYNECTIVVSFKPKAAGKQTGAVVLQDAEGNSIATAYLKGTGQGAVRPVGTTTTLSANPSTNLVTGDVIVLTASVTADSGPDVPSGTVTFADPAGRGVELMLIDGKAIYYGGAPSAGTYSVLASYNGGPGFAESKSATITGRVTAP